MTFTPGLLNHRAAASHPPAVRGRDPSSPEPEDTQPLHLEVLSPGGGAAPPHRSRLGASTRYHSVGLPLLLSLQPRISPLFPPREKAWLPSRWLGHFGAPGQSSIPAVS